MIDLFNWVASGLVTLLVLALILGNFFTVNTAQVAVVTRFG